MENGSVDYDDPQSIRESLIHRNPEYFACDFKKIMFDGVGVFGFENTQDFVTGGIGQNGLALTIEQFFKLVWFSAKQEASSYKITLFFTDVEPWPEYLDLVPKIKQQAARSWRDNKDRINRGERILRLKKEGATLRQIAKSEGISHGTVVNSLKGNKQRSRALKPAKPRFELKKTNNLNKTAQSIIEKFGSEFSSDLMNAIKTELSNT